MVKKNNLKEAPYEKVITYWDRAEGSSTDTPRLKHVVLASYVYPSAEIDWRPNDPFEATLELVHSSRGRSSVVFIYRDIATDIHYPLFVSSVDSMLRHATIKAGRVTGVWQVAKRGQNYGLEMLESV